MLRLLTRLAALGFVLVYLSGCAISPEFAKWRDKSAVLLAAQKNKAEQVRDLRGTKKVIYAGFALHADSTAFQGDVTLVRDAVRSVNSQISVLLLSNQFEHADLVYPFATKENIKSVLSSVARWADQETLVVLLFTSHGSPNLLRIKIGYGGYSTNLSANELRDYLAELKSIPTLLIISACFSGSFVPILANENRIIITAAAKDRVSFGCSFDSKATFFIEEFFHNNFNPLISLEQLFSQARKQVGERERRNKFSASQPQMFVGERMKNFTSVPIRELLTKVDGQ